MPRDTLTREQIVRAAIDLLDAEGLDGLNMRALGERLGSAATAVYWHVKNKDNLVLLAADALWDEIDLPDIDVVDWRTAATSMANDLYAMVARHPWLVAAMSAHLIYGPGKARHDDHLIAVYESAGFSGADVDWAMSTVVMFVLGRALGETADAAWRRRLRRDGGNEEEQVREVMTNVIEIATQFPRLRARVDAGESVDRSLEFGLQTIFDGLQVRLSIVD